MDYFTTDVKRWATLGSLVWAIWLVTATGVAADQAVRQALSGVREMALMLFS